jgi:hypothetical protein
MIDAILIFIFGIIVVVRLGRIATAVEKANERKG